MSSVLAKAQTLKPSIRLEQEIIQFANDLPKEQRDKFQAQWIASTKTRPTMSDTMRVTAEIDRAVTQSGIAGNNIGTRMVRILTAIQQFTTVADLLVSGSQNLIACGVWSAVRMTLLIFLNNHKALEKLSELFLAAGRSAPRYEKLIILYPQSKRLQSHYFEYFLTVVKLCRHFMKFAEKSTGAKVLAAFTDHSVEEFSALLHKWADAIEKEVGVLMAERVQDQSGQLNTIVHMLRLDSERRRHERRIRLYDSCSTYDFQTPWSEIRRCGTATWFTTRREYEDWKASKESCTLLYTGKLGSGKSIALASMVTDLHSQQDHVGVAYFFCQNDAPESLLARTILGSLTRQFLQLSEVSITIPDEFTATLPQFFNGERMRELLQRVMKRSSKACCLVDGLDECEGRQKNEVINWLRNLQAVFPLILCLSYRQEAANTMRLIRLMKPITVLVPDDNPDIGSFVNAELKRRIESEELNFGDPNIVLEIQDTLLEKAHGMFLWVALQITSLCFAKTDESIREALQNLPKDLPETFSRILKRSESLAEGYQRQILHLITAAHRPLTTWELQEALGVRIRDTKWNPERIPNNILATLACCGSLVIVDEETFSVRVIHHSVKQFLLSGSEGSMNHNFSFLAANETMFGVVTTYLRYDIFGKQLSKKTRPRVRYGTVPRAVVGSISESNTAQIALRLLKSREKTGSDPEKVFPGGNRSRATEFGGQFPFLSYARMYWVRHILHEEEADSEMYESIISGDKSAVGLRDNFGRTPLSWAAELGHAQISRSLIAHGAEVDSHDVLGRTALFFAARNGNDAVFRLLTANGAEIESKVPRNGQSLLSWAAAGGHLEMCRCLLDNGAHLESWNSSVSSSPIRLAAQGGHVDVMRLLLERGASLVRKESDDGSPLLVLAVQGGHVAMARLLLESGVATESKDDDGIMSALSWAAKWGEAAIAELLVEKGADVGSKAKGDRTTPLIFASFKGDEETVELLLNNRAEVEAKDYIGRTALSAAAMGGHEAVVRLLLERGADMESRADRDRTPLFLAAERGRYAVVKLLMEKGAAVDSRDDASESPLSGAARNGHTGTAQLLLANCASIDTKVEVGRTPLSYAASGGHRDMVELLLQKGADTEVRDVHGWTALSWAADNKAIVQLLKDHGVSETGRRRARARPGY